MKASIDTNIIGHLFRTGQMRLIENLFEEVYVDEFLLGELSRRCGDIYHDFLGYAEDNDSIFTIVTRSELIEEYLTPIYDHQIKDMVDLFFPRDEGEKRAIALAKTKGCFFLLTDDDMNKLDGPYYYIHQEMIPDMGVMGFWDLIYLNILLDKLDHHNATDVFALIATSGYTPEYKGTFKSKIKQSIRRLTEKQWFIDWAKKNGVKSIKIKQLQKFLRDQ